MGAGWSVAAEAGATSATPRSRMYSALVQDATTAKTARASGLALRAAAKSLRLQLSDAQVQALLAKYGGVSGDGCVDDAALAAALADVVAYRALLAELDVDAAKMGAADLFDRLAVAYETAPEASLGALVRDHVKTAGAEALAGEEAPLAMTLADLVAAEVDAALEGAALDCAASEAGPEAEDGSAAVPAAQEAAAEAAEPAPVLDDNVRAGDRCTARFGGEKAWFSGAVAAVAADRASAEVAYDDGDAEPAVPAALVRRLPDDRQLPAVPAVGARLEANFRGTGKWYGGRVTAAAEDGAWCDVEYDDGDAEAAVPRWKLRPEAVAAPAPVFAVGDKVEARYGEAEDAPWYAAHVSAAAADGPAAGEAAFVATYDDGEVQEGLTQARFRPAASFTNLMAAVASAKFKPGAKVTVDGAAVGEVACVWVDGTVSVTLADGGREKSCEEGRLGEA